MEKTLAERAEEARAERQRIRDEEAEKALSEMVAAIKEIFPEAEYTGLANFKIDSDNFIGCDRNRWPQESKNDNKYYLYPQCNSGYPSYTGMPIFDLADYGDFLKKKKECEKEIEKLQERPKFPQNETENEKPVRPSNITIEEQGCLAMIFNLFK